MDKGERGKGGAPGPRGAGQPRKGSSVIFSQRSLMLTRTELTRTSTKPSRTRTVRSTRTSDILTKLRQCSVFWATVCKTVRPLCYRSVVLSVCLSVCLSCLSVCLSVTFVHCGQTVGQIKMKLGTQVGLGPGHIVLHGDPAPPPPKGHSPPIFSPYQLRPNCCMDQGVTWYGARPRCFQWGSVPLCSDIKVTELPPGNMLIPLERQLIALQLRR